VEGCKNEFYNNMIHAYELGLLSEDDKKAFEIHLLECSHCLMAVREFERTVLHLKKEPSIREYIYEHTRTDEKAESVEEDSSRIGFFRKAKWSPVAAVLAFAVILTILIFQPWDIEIKRSKEAYAAENVLVVAYFRNLVDKTDTTNLGAIATNLLITDLSESSYLSVISSQRLFDILKILEKDEQKRSVVEYATQIAEYAQARWILSGAILQIQPSLVITTQLEDIKSGKVIASHQIQGQDEESIFDVIDKLTIATKLDLELPKIALNEVDPRIASITSTSKEAYRYYLEGKEYKRRVYNKEAIQSFEKALEYDSTFAPAYHELALIKDPGLINKAIEYIDNAGKLEKQYILALEATLSRDFPRAISKLESIIESYPQETDAYYGIAELKDAMGDVEGAIAYLEKSIELNPLYKSAYNKIAYVYDKAGRGDDAISAIRQYVSLAPNEANPYDSQGEILARNGRLDEAIESFKKAVEIKPDFLASILNLGDMYLFSRQYDRAQNTYHDLLSKASTNGRAYGRSRLAYIYIHQGKLDNALSVLEDGIRADKLEISKPSRLVPFTDKYLMRAWIYVEKQQYDLAVREFQLYPDQHNEDSPDTPYNYPGLYIWLLAKNKQFSDAEREAEKLRKQLDAPNMTRWPYYRALGCIDLEKGNIDRAINNFEKATEENDDFDTRFMLAEAYMSSARYDKAIYLFTELSNSYDPIRAFWGSWSAKIHYYLGIAYENTNQTDLALNQYEYFIEIWQDADPDLKIVEDTSQRLENAKLKLSL